MSVRDAFLKPAKRLTEQVEVPVLGVTVTVQGMTAKERSEWEGQFTLASGKPNKTKRQQFRERLVIACCVNSDGSSVFTESDIEILSGQPAAVLEPLVEAASRVSGISDVDAEKLGNDSGETEGST